MRSRFLPVTISCLIVGLFLLLAQAAKASNTQCHQCHPSRVTGPVPHPPVAGRDCVACHKSGGDSHQIDKALNSTRKKGAALCYDCHENLAMEKSVHLPVKDGECSACHDPHHSKYERLLKVPAAGLCFECHEKRIFSRPVKHSPVAAGKCGSCHVPHQSETPKLIRSIKGDFLCFDCHDSGISQGTSIHMPVGSRDCSACHDPHSTDAKKLLKAPSPDLCFLCHNKQQFTRPSPHEPVAAGRCNECHLPHNSARLYLIRPSEGAICFECHAPAPFIEGKSAHMPVRTGSCSICHAVHGSGNKMLLTYSYPLEPNAPFNEKNYAVCLQCHKRQAFTDNESTTDTTRFIDKTTNLHALHVKDAGVTCWACHSPHASDQALLVRGKSGKGNAPVTVRFIVTDRGGSCETSCHKDAQYKQ